MQGIKDYEPRVVQQLLDFVYRNVAEVLQVAEAFSNRASKKRNWDGGCHASYSSKSNYIPLLPLLRRTHVGKLRMCRSRDTASHCAALKIIESLPRCAS
ncbi:Transcription initiation factor TFIID subunit 9B [Trebouxia sp. C0009 RCD-2024]